MIDFSKPIQTRNGHKVRIICSDRQAPHPIVGLVALSGVDNILSWDTNGVYAGRSKHAPESDWDLVNVKVKKWRWVWQYNEATKPNMSHEFYTEEEAKKMFDEATHLEKIDFTEIEE